MKTLFKDILIFFTMLLIFYIICLFLPEQIPAHINPKGEIDMEINKYFLLIATIFPFSIYLYFFRNKR